MSAPADIVERLRERHCSDPHCWAWRHEGADEIKRLRRERDEARQKDVRWNAELQAERDDLTALVAREQEWRRVAERDVVALRAEVERLRAFIQPIADGDCTHINAESAWDDHPDCNEMIRDNPCLRCRARAALDGEGD